MQGRQWKGSHQFEYVYPSIGAAVKRNNFLWAEKWIKVNAECFDNSHMVDWKLTRLYRNVWAENDFFAATLEYKFMT